MTFSPAYLSALAFVLEREGGYSNDPADHGGATMRGVTQAVYDGWRAATRQPPQPVRQMTDDELHRIYYGYWLDAACDVLDTLGRGRLALEHFDCAINCGSGRARRLLQRALGLAEDGIIGPRTRAEIAAADESTLIERYAEIRAAFYKSLVVTNSTQRPFLNSWLARLRAAARATGTAISATFARTRENGAPTDDA